MQVCIQTLVLGRQIIILFLIHLLVDDILLSNTKSAARSLLMNFRSSARRLNARFKAAVTASRSSNVCTGNNKQVTSTIRNYSDIPLLILFVSAFSLDRFGRGESSSLSRHGEGK